MSRGRLNEAAYLALVAVMTACGGGGGGGGGGGDGNTAYDLNGTYSYTQTPGALTGNGVSECTSIGTTTGTAQVTWQSGSGTCTLVIDGGPAVTGTVSGNSIHYSTTQSHVEGCDTYKQSWSLSMTSADAGQGAYTWYCDWLTTSGTKTCSQTATITFTRAGAACGASGQSCCSGNTCNSGLTCSSGTCQAPPACGGSGQPCCSGNTCNGGLTCSSGTCQAPLGIPLAPSNMIVSGVTQTTATLGWQDNATNETSYVIGRCTGIASVDGNGVRHCMSGFLQVATAAANATSYTLSGLTAGTTYGYYVLARNAAGDSGNVGTEFTTASAMTTLTVVNNHCLPITELTLNGGANLLATPIPPDGAQRTITGISPGNYTIHAESQEGVTWNAPRTIPSGGLVVPLVMPAGTGCLRVQNSSGYTLYELYVIGSTLGCNSNIWGSDYLSTYLSSGASFTISQMSPGYYDLLAYNSGQTRYWTDCYGSLINVVAGQTFTYTLTP